MTGPKSTLFSIREVSPGDVPGIVRLIRPFEYADGPDEDVLADIYRWQLVRSPAGSGKALVGVDSEGAIVAHESLMPIRVLRKGKLELAALPSRLVVDERFRKSMLFLRMESMLLRSYGASGVEFLYCSARNHLRSHYALGFRSIGTIPVLARPYRLEPVARHAFGSLAPLASVARPPVEWALRRSWIFSGRGVEVTRESRFEEQLDPFLQRTQRFFEIAAERSVATLNWRFGVPHRGYVLLVAKDQGGPAGYIVLRDMPMGDFRTLALVDLFYEPARTEVGAALLRAAHEVAVKLGVDLASCLITPASPLHSAVRRAGFLRTPESFELMVHQPKGATPLDASDFASWHMTWYDHDHV